MELQAWLDHLLDVHPQVSLLVYFFISSPTNVDNSILTENGGREKKKKESLQETAEEEEFPSLYTIKCIAKES